MQKTGLGTKLTQANLAKANLAEANLAEANLDKANLDEAAEAPTLEISKEFDTRSPSFGKPRNHLHCIYHSEGIPMAQLVPIQLEDGTEIYIEATEDVDVSPTAQAPVELQPEEVRRGQKGWGGGGGSRGMVGFPSGGNGSSASNGSAAIAAQSFKAIEGTIRTYTTHTLSAFKDMAHGNVDKVTLQFGIRVGGEAGVPYVTKGTAESNLSITVECSFDKDS